MLAQCFLAQIGYVGPHWCTSVENACQSCQALINYLFSAKVVRPIFPFVFFHFFICLPQITAAHLYYHQQLSFALPILLLIVTFSILASVYSNRLLLCCWWMATYIAVQQTSSTTIDFHLFHQPLASVCVASMILEHLSLCIYPPSIRIHIHNLLIQFGRQRSTDQVNAKVYQRTLARETVSRDSDHQRFDHLPILYSSQRPNKEVLRLSAEKRAIPFLSFFLFFFSFAFFTLSLSVCVSVRRTGHLFCYKYIAFRLLPQKKKKEKGTQLYLDGRVELRGTVRISGRLLSADIFLSVSSALHWLIALLLHYRLIVISSKCFKKSLFHCLFSLQSHSLCVCCLRYIWQCALVACCPAACHSANLPLPKLFVCIFCCIQSSGHTFTWFAHYRAHKQLQKKRKEAFAFNRKGKNKQQQRQLPIIARC